MALTPPRLWPAEMLDAVLRNNWRTPLLAGLVRAAAAYSDARWCTTLIAVTAQAWMCARSTSHSRTRRRWMCSGW